MHLRLPAPGRLLPTLVLATAVLASPSAHADTTGVAGRVVGLEHVDNDSDEYAVYHGRVYLDTADGSYDQYYWGGVLCSARDLAVDQQLLLQQAMLMKKGAIVPYWKAGQGGVSCLVSFTVAPSTKVAPDVTR